MKDLTKGNIIKALRNRAEHFESIGNHKYEETECRCALDIVERLLPDTEIK